MSNEPRHVCPVERAGGLDRRLRRWVQNPRRILSPYIREGMTVVDLGCGPGFFTLDMAEMVGPTGRVIAADFQEGMLALLRRKIRGTALQDRISLHRCEEERIGLAQKVDFALAFYLIHEVPDQEAFFREVASILEPDGRLLVVEPPFHVSREAFADSIRRAREAGLRETAGPRVLLSKVAMLARAPDRSP